MGGMDIKKWFEETSRQRVTDARIAEILDVTRKTANKRINEGLTADDMITVSRGLGISPIHALVELGKLTYPEVADFLESDGVLLESASQEQLIYQLATESLPISDRIALGAAAKAIADRRDDLAIRRSNKASSSADPLDDEEVADIIREANAQPKAAHPATDIEYTEPEFP